MNFLAKKSVSFFVLASFGAVALFGLVLMSHGGVMLDACPFSPMSDMSCSQSFSAIIHHASSYFSFLNISLSILVLAIGLMILVSWFFHRSLLPALSGIFRQSSSLFVFKEKKLRRWLSLFEHSPSIV